LFFLIIAIFACAISLTGIINISSVGNSYSIAFSDVVECLESVEGISSALQQLRADLFEIALADNQLGKEEAAESLKEHRGEIDENLNKYRKILERYKASEVAEEVKLIEAIDKSIKEFDVGSQKFVNVGMDTSRRAEAYRMLSNGGEVDVLTDNMNISVNNVINYLKLYSDNQIKANKNLVSLSILIMITIAIFGLFISLALVYFISQNISKRINKVVQVADKLSVGNLNFNIEDDSKDEIGLLSKSFLKMSNTLTEIIGDITYGLERMSNGDFTVDSNASDLYVGDYTPLTESMYKTMDRMSSTLQQISIAADQVSTGSSQVSSGAQALAAGSTEQAASIQELSASIEKIADQIAENSSIINASSQYVNQSGIDTEAGNKHMDQLTKAMEEIGQASNQIANITKAIEDIAFQTNILALNAAIEAARAGSAGKGFAVVADEVRALAAKSGEAAKQTVELISASVDAVAKGTEIAAQTAQILKNIGASANNVIESFDHIKNSSAEQATAIEFIKEGISQISSVIQTNAANAEENSATSEEMSAQAATLRNEVEQFKFKKITAR
jgi:methyl-accepting chemotaxis protein